MEHPGALAGFILLILLRGELTVAVSPSRADVIVKAQIAENESIFVNCTSPRKGGQRLMGSNTLVNEKELQFSFYTTHFGSQFVMCYYERFVGDQPVAGTNLPVWLSPTVGESLCEDGGPVVTQCDLCFWIVRADGFYLNTNSGPRCRPW